MITLEASELTIIDVDESVDIIYRHERAIRTAQLCAQLRSSKDILRLSIVLDILDGFDKGVDECLRANSILSRV